MHIRNARPRWLVPFCMAFAVHAWGQNAATTVSVDAAANKHPINPNIYGIAYGDAHDMQTLNAPLNRWGGNSTSRYNWQIDAHSAGSDWYFETYSDGTGTASGSADSFLQTTRTQKGAEPVFTIPMLDWLANLGPNRNSLEGFSVKKYGAQTAADPYNSDAGNGISAATNQDITGNNPIDTGVANSPSVQQDWVQHFVSEFGSSSTAGGVKYYLLDNEPSLWNSTHRDVHPNPDTYDELYNRVVSYVTAIRKADPYAKIGGFEEWTWWAMYLSGLDQKNGLNAANSDYNTHNKTYYYPYLLQKLYAYQQSSGMRVLDMLTVHCYNQAPGNNDDSASGQQVRNRETRILWDPSFVDPSWMGTLGINGGVLNWIPTLKQFVSQYYPGLEVGCTEYNWGDEPNLNGATTQADVLGIYGRQGLDFATRWTEAKNTGTNPTTYYPTYLASQIYRNYDGNGSGFGDLSISASVPNPDNLSSFAALRSSDGALTVMVINKQAGSTPLTINLANFTASTSAQVWQINSPSQSAIESLTAVPVTNNAIATTVPSQSITLFVIPTGSGHTSGSPVFTSTARATPASVSLGGSTAIAFTLHQTQGSALTNANVELQIFNASGSAVATNTWSGQSFAPGQAKSYSYRWTVPSTLPNGAYTVAIGVFNSAWSTNYSWNGNAAQITVTGNPGPPTFASHAAASPASLTRPATTTISCNVFESSGAAVSGANVELQIFNSAGAAVATNVWSSQNFASGQNNSYNYRWNVPASLAPGSYTAMIGVFNSAWSTDYSWNSSAATITVK